MKINRTINEHNEYDFDFTNDNKVLVIYQDEDGEDLYLACRYIDYRRVSNITFEIHEQDELYPIIDKLYESIIEEAENDKIMYKNIVKKGVITIYCDMQTLEYPNILKIFKEKDKIKLEFNKVEGKGVFKPAFTIFISSRKNNSRIPSISSKLHTMYEELQNIEIKKEKTRIRE